MADTGSSSGAGSLQRSYMQTARDLAQTREQIWKSFEASSKLLEGIDLPDADSADALLRSKRTTDYLVNQLSLDQLDMHSDLSHIMEVYRSGQISAEKLEAMIRNEQERGAFLVKVALALRTQLETIFDSYSELADKLETGDGSHLSLDLNPNLNNIFLEFNEAINTAQLIGEVAKTPASKLQKTLPVMHSHIDTIASTAAVAQQHKQAGVANSCTTAKLPPSIIGYMSSSDFQQSPVAELQYDDLGVTTPGHLTSSQRAVSSPMNDDERDETRDDLSVHSNPSIKTAMSLSRVLIRQEIGSQTDLSYDNGNGFTALSPSLTGGGAQAPLSGLVITETSTSISESSGIAFADLSDTLRIEGRAAKRGDRKEKEKLAALLDQRQKALTVQEQLVAEQRAFIDERTVKLASMAQRLASQELELQDQARLLEEEVARRLRSAPRGVRSSIEGGSSLDPSANLPSGGGLDIQKSLAVDSVNTQSFLDSGLEAALAGQARTEAEERSSAPLPTISVGTEAVRRELDHIVASLVVRGERFKGGNKPPSRGDRDMSRPGSSGHFHSSLLDGGGGGHTSPVMHPLPKDDIADDLSSVLSQQSRGAQGRLMEMGHSDDSSSFILVPKIEAPPPFDQQPHHIEMRASKNDMIVIFPATKCDSQTDMSDFRAYLANQAKGGDPMQPQSVAVEASVKREKRGKGSSAGVAAINAADEDIDTEGDLHLDDSDDEKEGKEKKKRGANTQRKTSKSTGRSSSPTQSIVSQQMLAAGPSTDSLLGDPIIRAKVSLLLPTAIPASNPAARAADGGLPIVASSTLGLTTRTYKPPPALDVAKALQESDNPLLTLLKIYSPSLPDVFQALLLEAAAGAGLGKSQAAVEKMFGPMAGPLSKLDAAALASLRELTLCEDLSNSLIVLLDSGEVPMDTYRRSLAQLFTQISQAEGVRLWIEVQLVSYRTIYERVRALSISMLGDLSRECPSFKESFDSFTSCQSRLVEISHRCEAVKERCVRYRLADADTWRQISGGGADINGGVNGNSPTMALGALAGLGPHRSLGAEGSVSLDDALELEAEVDRLRRELRDAQEEAEETNLEVFRVMQEGDRTPAALMFFAALHDPVIVSVLQQLVLQLSKLKGFADGSAHVDFPEVRKRLQVCLSCAPSIERLVQRYSVLHKKWTANRLGVFTSRGLTGGSGDATNLCPMCCNDSTVFAPPKGPLQARRERQALQHEVTLAHGGEAMAQVKQQRRNKKLERISQRIEAAEVQLERGANVPSRVSTAMTDRTNNSQSLPVLQAVGSGGNVGFKRQLISAFIGQPKPMPPSRG